MSSSDDITSDGATRAPVLTTSSSSSESSGTQPPCLRTLAMRRITSSPICSEGRFCDEGDAQGYTCLHAASSYGHHDLLRYLLAQVAVDVNCKDEDGDSPLHVCEDVETAKILLDAGADPGAPNGAGQVPYEVAAEEERSEVAQYLADAHPGFARAGLTRPNLAGVSSGPDCESMTVTIEELAKACGEDGTVDVQMAMDQAQDGKRRRV